MSNYEESSGSKGQAGALVSPRRAPAAEPTSPMVSMLLWANVGIHLSAYLLNGFAAAATSLALQPQAVAQGHQLWSVLTYMFVHGNETHLIMNMVGLVLLGREIEVVMGRAAFMAMYLLSGLVGGLGFVAMALLTGNSAPCVGASGAICGILGALVALYPNQRLYIVFIPWLPMRAWVLGLVLATIHVFFMLTPYGGRVAYDVHLFGGFTGYVFCLLLARRLRGRRLPPLDRPEPEPEGDTLFS